MDRDFSPAENPLDAHSSVQALLYKALAELQPTPAKPPGPKLEMLKERLAARLQDLEITDGIDVLVVKPRKYLDQAWSEINQVIRSLGGRWQKGSTSADRSRRILKRS